MGEAMRTRWSILVTAVALVGAFVIGSSDSWADGSQRLGFVRRESGRINYVTAATYGVLSGTVTVTGIPAGATVRLAYLHTHSWDFETIGALVGAVTFQGTVVPRVDIGFEGGNGFRNTFRGYRSDVTALVAGNGSYSWSLPGGRGGALLVIYDDPSAAADYDIEFHDGVHCGGSTDGAQGSWPNPTLFTGFVVDGQAPREVDVAFLVENGDLGFSDAYAFAAGLLPLSTLALNQATMQYEWDRLDVSSRFSGGETQAQAQMSEGSDAICWQAAVLRVRTSPPITDVTPPEIQVISHADGAVVASSPATVRVCVRDESGTTISSIPPLVWSPSSLSAPSAGESSAIFALAEGSNGLTVTAVDGAGHSSSTSLTLILDTVTPAVAITSPADGSVVGTPSLALAFDVADATATDTVSDPGGIVTSLPAGGGSASVVVALIEGANALSVSATDEAGHSGGTSIIVTLDTVPPAIDFQSPAAGAVFGLSPVTLTLAVADATATSVSFGANSLALPAGGGMVSGPVDLVEGLNTITASAVDAAGNPTSASIDLVLDLSAPVVTIDSPADGACFGPGESPVAVVATVDDLTATSVASTPSGVSGSLPAGGGVVSGAVALVEGMNAISVSATDQTSTTGSGSVTVILDTTPPSVAVDSPSDLGLARGTIDFNASATDVAPGTGVAQVDFFVDGGLQSSLTAAPFETSFDTTTIADGSHAFSATAADGKGNAASAAVQVTVDNTAPDLAITSPADGLLVSGTIGFDALASDAVSGLVTIEMSANGLAPVPFDDSATFLAPQLSTLRSSLVDTTFFADGPLALSARTVDAAGNESTAAVTITVDNTAPVKALVAPADLSTVAGLLAISADAQDPNLDTLEILVDGVSLGSSTTSPFDVSFDTTSRLDGALLVSVIARDLAGNTSTCSASVTVDNIRFEIAPRVFNLNAKNSKAPVTAGLEGVNVALLLPTEAHAIELRVPGGNPVPSTAGFPGDDATFDTDGDGLPQLLIKFDRQLLSSSLRAGIAAGLIQPGGNVVVTLVAEGGYEIGRETMRVIGH